MTEIPIEPDPQFPKPWATHILLAINVAVFIAMVISGISVMEPSTTDLIRCGADFGPLTLTSQPWRVVTASFLHIGIIHLLLNMWCLWNLGPLLERFLGVWGALLAYVATGIGAAIASLSWNPMRVSAGASGAIFGFVGILISILYFAKLDAPPEGVRATLRSVVQFALINLVYGFAGGIDNMAHLGGLISGLVIGLFLSKELANAIARFAILIGGLAVVSALLVPLRTIKADSIRFYQGLEALRRHEFTSAIALLQSYTKNVPSDAEGFGQLGFALHSAKRYSEAILAYEKALALRPSYPEVEINLANLYFDAHRLDEAIRLYSEVLPDLAPAARHYLDFAHALHDRQRYAEAETQIRKALQLDDKSLEAHALLADTLAMMGKSEESAHEYRRANELLPKAAP